MDEQLEVFQLKVFQLARVYSLSGPGVMPIAKEHMELLKNGSTQIQFAQENPKKPGSKAWDRYEAYKGTTTIAQATENKAGWQDLTADFEKRVLEDHARSGRGYSTRFHQKPKPQTWCHVLYQQKSKILFPK